MPNITIDTLRAFETKICTTYPGVQIKFKDESTLMKLLGFLSYPFNPDFMTSYTTTLGKTMWFPTKADYEGQPRSSFGVMAHELVHIVDGDTRGWLLDLGVMFPQVLCVIPLIAYAVCAGWHGALVYAALVSGLLVALFAARLSTKLFWGLFVTTVLGVGTLAVMTTGWWSLLLLAGIACMAPWPSPSRTYFELRGYSMQLGIMQWFYNQVPQLNRDHIRENFVGSDYYFMSWSAADMTRRIDEVVARAANGSLAKDAPYDFVYAFCVANGLIEGK
jgi:hypothetical protein